MDMDMDMDGWMDGFYKYVWIPLVLLFFSICFGVVTVRNELNGTVDVLTRYFISISKEGNNINMIMIITTTMIIVIVVIIIINRRRSTMIIIVVVVVVVVIIVILHQEWEWFSPK